MKPLKMEPWFRQETTPVGILRGLRDMFLLHPERYIENMLWANSRGLFSRYDQPDDAYRVCAIGACRIIGGAMMGNSASNRALELLAAELPKTQGEFDKVAREWGGGIRAVGASRGFLDPGARVATCSNLLGPEFIAAKCECALRKLED